jgi:hypothetical protein
MDILVWNYRWLGVMYEEVRGGEKITGQNSVLHNRRIPNLMRVSTVCHQDSLLNNDGNSPENYRGPACENDF